MPRRPTTDGSDLGRRLRAARTAKGLTLAALAEQADVTKGFISQLERGLCQASVPTLRRLCAALDVAPGELLDPLPSGAVAAHDAPEISFGGYGARDRLLTPVGFPLQALHSTVEPGGYNPGTGPIRPQESHFVLVLSGSFELTIDGERVRLGPGQSISFRGSSSYSSANPSADTPCELVWVFSPPEL